jgi:hypothetical protein
MPDGVQRHQMKTESSPFIDPAVEPLRERRRRARARLSCFILVRPFEPEPDYFESIILTDESCRNGLSFQTDNALFRERMRVLVTFPYSRHPSAINRDYLAEVVRTEARQDGRCSIALRVLTAAKLSIPPISKLRSSNVWNVLWQRARAHTNPTRMDHGGSMNRSR